VPTVDYRWDEAASSALPDDLDRLLYLARLVGSDESLFQAGGGGVSLKRRQTDPAGRSLEVLWVKGTGARLKDLRRQDLVPVRLEEVRLLGRRETVGDEEMRDYLVSCTLDARALAPSIQTPIHAYLPAPWVVFTLDWATQSLTDTSKKDAWVREVFGDEVAYLGYLRPGFPLARGVRGLGDLSRVKGIVLGKHGLVTWGATAKGCYDRLHDLLSRAEEFLRRPRPRNPLARQRRPPPEPARRDETARLLLPVLRGALSSGGRVVLCRDDSEEALRFAGSELARQAHRRGMAAPEHILHCGRQPLYVDADLERLPPDEAAGVLRRAVGAFEEEYRISFAKHGRGDRMLGPGPRVTILPGLGIVSAGRDAASAAVASLCYRHVSRVIVAAETIDQFRFLEEAGAFEFEYWPLELERLARPEKELARRVAVVTGGARGIGRAIAERFALEGCHVVLTDLEGAEEAADAVARKAGDPRRALGVRADAASEKETREAFTRAVLAYGGVDLLVANAGLVRTGPVEEVSLETWRRHLDANLTGCFLAAREAARIFRAQGTGGAILLNASKAAFAAPRENAAYAASKAAVAHLARNLAVELGPAGVRVNYFNADFIDTPMIRQIARERAAQKGVSEEAQLEEYRQRNLLKAGPIPAEAVAEAALFLAGDRARYTTGGVLTIDGGLIDAMPR
jgi:rhamnulose-1-phosphate aldolase/alcohol dehydrogenase